MGRAQCFAQRYEGELVLNWSSAFIDSYCADVAADGGGTYGPYLLKYLRSGLRSVLLGDDSEGNGVRGASGLVMGSERPWVECLLLNEGARLVTTFEYASINSGDERLRTPSLRTIASDALTGTLAPVDIIVSFSSLEHSGLGRYGDALNPDGDRDAVAQAWCMLRPGGVFLLAVPMTCTETGEIVFNAHRVYGFERLAYIATHFLLEGFVGGSCEENSQPIVILRKPRELIHEPTPLSASDFAWAASRGS